MLPLRRQIAAASSSIFARPCGPSCPDIDASPVLSRIPPEVPCLCDPMPPRPFCTATHPSRIERICRPVRPGPSCSRGPRPVEQTRSSETRLRDGRHTGIAPYDILRGVRREHLVDLLLCNRDSLSQIHRTSSPIGPTRLAFHSGRGRCRSCTFAVAMHQGGGGWVFQCSTSLT